MSESDSLTGVWEGLYSYPRRLPPNAFTAVLLQSGSHIGGQIHEVSDNGPSRGATLIAALEGQRSGAAVSFVKTYEPGPDHRRAVRYEGRLNADATEIEGTWTIAAHWSGRFIMMRSRKTETKAQAAAKASESALLALDGR